MVRASRERIRAVDKAYKLIWDVHYALWNNRTQSQPLQKPTLRETRMEHVLRALDEQWDCVKRLGMEHVLRALDEQWDCGKRLGFDYIKD